MDAAQRSLVRGHAGGRCEYCGILQAHIPFAAFHVGDRKATSGNPSLASYPQGIWSVLPAIAEALLTITEQNTLICFLFILERLFLFINTISKLYSLIYSKAPYVLEEQYSGGFFLTDLIA